jgi:hypothetical protein
MRAVLAVAAGVVALLAGAEAVLRLLPVSTATMTGYHVDPDLLTYPPGHVWTTSHGWDLRNPQRLRANNTGFVAERDFQPDARAVALIGDSYVESGMLGANLRPGRQLEDALGGSRAVFAMGSPGTALLDYAQRVRFASENYGVSDFVIWLERGDARQALCGSGNVHSRCLDRQTFVPRVERASPPSRAKRVLRHSALAQYLAGHLDFQGDRFIQLMFTRRPPALPGIAAPASGSTAVPGLAPAAKARERAVIDAAVDEFFRVVGPHLTGRTVFIVDGLRQAPSPAPQTDPFQRAYLIERLEARGAEVVDMEPIYLAHARSSPMSLEVGPYDQHLNGLGVRLAARAAAAALDR